jgi:tetratricopeptide (TPR) repeat protein
MSRPERTLDPGRSALDRFGYELRRWRKMRGLSQDRLGPLVHVSGDLIQRIEVGARRPSRDLAERCDAALRADGALVLAWDALRAELPGSAGSEADADNLTADTDKGLQETAERPMAMRIVMPAVSVDGDGITLVLCGPAEGDGSVDEPYTADRAVIPCRTEDGRIIWVSVPRRGFLLSGVGAAASAISGPTVAQGRSAARLVARAGATSGSPFERFEAMRKVLMDCDNLFGPTQVIKLTREQLAIVGNFRKNAQGKDRGDLLDVEIQFADLLSWLYQDSGDRHNAQYWLGRALDLSHILGDNGTVAFILARKSQLAGQFQDGAEAIEVAEAAMRYNAPNRLSTIIATIYAAHGYALRGEKDASLRAYNRAHELLADVADERATWYGKFLNPAYVEVQRAHSLSVGGDYRQAAGAFQAALDTLSESYFRDRGVYLARKALAHAGAASTRENDAEEHAIVAADSGLEALAIAMETRSGRIDAELTRVDNSLALWHQLPRVSEFRETLNDARPLRATAGHDEDVAGE